MPKCSKSIRISMDIFYKILSVVGNKFEVIWWLVLSRLSKKLWTRLARMCSICGKPFLLFWGLGEPSWHPQMNQWGHIWLYKYVRVLIIKILFLNLAWDRMFAFILYGLWLVIYLYFEGNSRFSMLITIEILI